MPRRAAATASTSYAESNDSADEEQATPKPRKGKKKRVSDVYHAAAEDDSLEAEGARPPLRSISYNDDALEKRRRRKSTKLVSETEQGTPRARQLQTVPLAAVVQVNPRIDVPFDVMSSNFEEWMKMATDNKINAANSWNFALIDYFHDMSLLRNADAEQSVNFQKASLTLDGCVKIWTSRVDSVGTETGKLLSNLANEGRADLEDDDGDGGEDGDGPRGESSKRAKPHRPEATLAKNASQLRAKKLDLEFSVDPLFKKTCADFDEGGAGGLLMNHLGLDGQMRIVFDASDAAVKGEDEEDEQEPQDFIDLGQLQADVLPDLAGLDDMAICHSLADFEFSMQGCNGAADDSMFVEHVMPSDSEASDAGGFDDDLDDVFGTPEDPSDPFAAGPEHADAAGPVEDFFVGDQAVHDDFGDDGFADGGSDDMPAPEGDGNGGTHGQNVVAGAFVPFDPRNAPNQRDLIMAMTEADGDGGMLDYFDQGFLKNWAGPEHWKLRKAVRRVEPSEQSGPKPRREKKEPFKIDFFTPSEVSLKEAAKALFAPATRSAGINLPASKANAKGRSKGRKANEPDIEANTLPDDIHFSSRQLVTLFLKPKFSLKMRGHYARFNDRGDGEVDEEFWAQAAAEQNARLQGENEEGSQNGDIPFNTQFFHDDDFADGGGGFDDVDDMGPVGVNASISKEDDVLAAAAHETRKFRPEAVNYAKRAKRVDVRKLKENIWKELALVVPSGEDDSSMNDDRLPLTDANEGRQFDQVIGRLTKVYPSEKMQEISTSFCFICLLHLANEQGLKIEVGSSKKSTDDREDSPSARDDGRVGNLWGLQVYRDPNATKSA